MNINKVGVETTQHKINIKDVSVSVNPGVGIDYYNYFCGIYNVFHPLNYKYQELDFSESLRENSYPLFMIFLGLVSVFVPVLTVIVLGIFYLSSSYKKPMSQLDTFYQNESFASKEDLFKFMMYSQNNDSNNIIQVSLNEIKTQLNLTSVGIQSVAQVGAVSLNQTSNSQNLIKINVYGQKWKNRVLTHYETTSDFMKKIYIAKYLVPIFCFIGFIMTFVWIFAIY